jgi:hypothetical protein
LPTTLSAWKRLPPDKAHWGSLRAFFQEHGFTLFKRVGPGDSEYEPADGQARVPRGSWVHWTGRYMTVPEKCAVIQCAGLSHFNLTGWYIIDIFSFKSLHCRMWRANLPMATTSSPRCRQRKPRRSRASRYPPLSLVRARRSDAFNIVIPILQEIQHEDWTFITMPRMMSELWYHPGATFDTLAESFHFIEQLCSVSQKRPTSVTFFHVDRYGICHTGGRLPSRSPDCSQSTSISLPFGKMHSSRRESQDIHAAKVVITTWISARRSSTISLALCSLAATIS